LAAEALQHDKSLLRRKFKELRRQHRVGKGPQDHLARLLRDYPEHQICLYRARSDEASCDLQPVTRYFYPVTRDGQLEFRRPLTPQAFSPSSLGILEPLVAQSQPLDLQQPTVICCPAVAVDTQGVRMGMGQGYYDRFFATHTHCLRVGVVYQIQVSSDPLPAESWDQPVDWIVTEQMILRTSSPQRSSLLWT
jgi:5,10-methenyltetrahydrofolate synthetase